VQDNAVWLDLRCLRDEAALQAQLVHAPVEDRS
jgi:hypothetical protein